MVPKVSHSNYLPVHEDWLAQRTETPLEPHRPIIDAHHHLWSRDGWRYLDPELLDDIVASGHRIVATVFVQCQTGYRSEGPQHLLPVGETEYIASLAAAYADRPTRLCAAIVGHVDLRFGERVKETLEAHLEAGRGRFRGIRHIVAYDTDHSLMNPLSVGPPDLLNDRRWREGFAQLAAFDLSFDAWLFHPQIDDLAQLASDFPETRIVLNHLGGIVGIGAYVGRRDEIFSSWRQSVRTLARCHNVSVKLGGLGMRINGFGFERGDSAPSSDDLIRAWRPYIETCLEAFGAERCMFESNFPVDKGSYAYGVGWNAFKKLAQETSEDERDRLFFKTANSFYRLGLEQAQPGAGPSFGDKA